MKNALAKQPFADFTAEQKRYKITLRVTLTNSFRNWRFINRLIVRIVVLVSFQKGLTTLLGRD